MFLSNNELANYLRVGGHAKSCADVIKAENKFELIGFVDKEAKQTLRW